MLFQVPLFHLILIGFEIVQWGIMPVLPAFVVEMIQSEIEKIKNFYLNTLIDCRCKYLLIFFSICNCIVVLNIKFTVLLLCTYTTSWTDQLRRYPVVVVWATLPLPRHLTLAINNAGSILSKTLSRQLVMIVLQRCSVVEQLPY